MAPPTPQASCPASWRRSTIRRTASGAIGRFMHSTHVPTQQLVSSFFGQDRRLKNQAASIYSAGANRRPNPLALVCQRALQGRRRRLRLPGRGPFDHPHAECPAHQGDPAHQPPAPRPPRVGDRAPSDRRALRLLRLRRDGRGGRCRRVSCVRVRVGLPLAGRTARMGRCLRLPGSDPRGG